MWELSQEQISSLTDLDKTLNKSGSNIVLWCLDNLNNRNHKIRTKPKDWYKSVMGYFIGKYKNQAINNQHITDPPNT